MRLLHLHSSFNPGGKELRAAKLIGAFGAQVRHTIVSGVPGAMGAAGAIDPAMKVDYPQDFPPLSGPVSLARLRAVAEAMRGHDLVLTYNWGAMDAVMAHRLYARRLGLPPLVHHEDGFNQDEAEGLKPARNLFRRLALPTAAALVVPSQTLERIALDIWKQPRGRVRRVPNGIALADFARPPRLDAVPGLVKQPGDLWIGTLAGLRAVKNLPALVEAFRAVPEPWKLVIVGEGPERAAIAGRAAELGLSDRVFLPGHAPDPAAVMPLFDLFALSSDSEQFPISVVEAMAAGIAVASTDVGDVAAMLSDANRPLVDGVRDAGALGQVLERLAADPALRAAIGQANKARAEAEYGEAAMVAAYRAIYGGALGRQSFP
ncbi:MAG TPA: glycosyltransferase family 4 protein [Novosphingobium sp.]|nr:glycosyltransferase family 4 protein [Novosphingobium sp.]